jgi:hypothetical protein
LAGFTFGFIWRIWEIRENKSPVADAAGNCPSGVTNKVFTGAINASLPCK